MLVVWELDEKSSSFSVHRRVRKWPDISVQYGRQMHEPHAGVGPELRQQQHALPQGESQPRTWWGWPHFVSSSCRPSPQELPADWSWEMCVRACAHVVRANVHGYCVVICVFYSPCCALYRTTLLFYVYHEAKWMRMLDYVLNAGSTKTSYFQHSGNGVRYTGLSRNKEQFERNIKGFAWNIKGFAWNIKGVAWNMTNLCYKLEVGLNSILFVYSSFTVRYAFFHTRASNLVDCTRLLALVSVSAGQKSTVGKAGTPRRYSSFISAMNNS